MSQTVINNWHDRNDDKDFIKIRKECEKDLYKMYDDALAEEKRWTTYLFSKGAMIGLSEKTVTPVCRIHGFFNRRMKAIGTNTTIRPKNKSTSVVDHAEFKGYTKRTTRNRD